MVFHIRSNVVVTLMPLIFTISIAQTPNPIDGTSTREKLSSITADHIKKLREKPKVQDTVPVPTFSKSTKTLDIKLCLASEDYWNQPVETFDLKKFQQRSSVLNKWNYQVVVSADDDSNYLPASEQEEKNDLTINLFKVTGIGLKCPRGNSSFKIEAQDRISNSDFEESEQRQGQGRVYLDMDGFIVTSNNTFGPQDYCISNFTDQVLIAVVCIPETTVHQKEEPETYNTILFFLYCVVSFFLFLIVFFYGLTWRYQQTHGWVILAFSTSNFFSYFFWTISLGVWQFEPVEANGLRKVMIGTPFCASNIALVHYFDISAFTWMTILNFDICHTIRSMAVKWNRSEGKLRFLIYSCFGYGIPLIILMISLLREYEYGHFKGREHRQQFGYDPCGLDKYYATWHVQSLNGVAVTLKVVFIVLVVQSLIEYHRGNKKLRKEERKLRSQTFLYCKLFVLMDFTWVFEIIWASNFGENNTNSWYRSVQDAIYIFQALFLFWVFVCKREMKDILTQHYPIFDDIFTFFCANGKSQRNIESDISADIVGSGGPGGGGNKVCDSNTDSTFADSRNSAASDFP